MTTNNTNIARRVNQGAIANPNQREGTRGSGKQLQNGQGHEERSLVPRNASWCVLRNTLTDEKQELWRPTLKSPASIYRDLRDQMGENQIIQIQGALAIIHDNSICTIRSASGLFRIVRRFFDGIYWARGTGLLTKKEFYEFLKQIAPSPDWAELPPSKPLNWVAACKSMHSEKWGQSPDPFCSDSLPRIRRAIRDYVIYRLLKSSSLDQLRDTVFTFSKWMMQEWCHIATGICLTTEELEYLFDGWNISEITHQVVRTEQGWAWIGANRK